MPQTHQRLKLPDVTIFSADSAYVDLTARALTVSMEQCEFADAILCSDQAVAGPFRHVPVEPLRSIIDYSMLCLTRLPDLIETRFVLIVQWDGFIVNPAAWRRDFLKYDYIGAPWYGIFPPGRRVGNGGFSLRSRKMLDAARQLPWIPEHGLDQVICQICRPALEKDFGIRFADERIADHFSYEFGYKDSFGFHGFQNMWRHHSDEEMRAIARIAWSGSFHHWKSAQLLSDSYRGGRVALAETLYADLRRLLTFADLLKAAAAIPGSEGGPKVLPALHALEERVAPCSAGSLLPA